jgi:type IV pilus assembly protein PilV
MRQHLLRVNTDKEAGFTLIEFCVATLIMMVGLLGLLQGVNIAIEQNLGNLLRNEAASVADEQMVTVKAAATVLSNWTALATTTSSVVRKVRGGNCTFTINRTVATKTTKSKEVSIAVSWTYKSKTLSHKITSLILSP